MCADIVIWDRGLPAQQGRSELTSFCYKLLFMKLFKTSNLDIVRYCQEQFCFELPSVILARLAQNLKLNLVTLCQINISNSLLCNIW